MPPHKAEEAGQIDPCARLRRRLARERRARQEAELISERDLQGFFFRQQEIQLSGDIANTVNLSHSVRDVFQYALARICDFTAWPIGHAYAVEVKENQASLEPMALWRANNEKEVSSLETASEIRWSAVDGGLPGKVYASRKPIWWIDIRNDPSFHRREAAETSGMMSACGFPILIGEEVVAVFEFFTHRKVGPSPQMFDLLLQIGAQLGRAVERQRAEDRLIHDATHDPLTGLPNRALFRDRLNQAIVRLDRDSEAQFAVLFIDLDRFKLINDGLGHLAGDKLIIQVADRLRRTLRREDSTARFGQKIRSGEGTLARLGGDEFTILLTDISDPSDAARVGNRLGEVLGRPFLIDGQEVYSTASIGIASSVSGYKDADAVLRDADLAMYRAKQLGREVGKTHCELFDQGMHQVAVKRLALETDMRRAMREREFVLHYQPIVSLDTKTISGFEALIRWKRPDGEIVYPADFIHVAEDTGLIILIGQWVLREACRAIRSLQKRFPRKEPLTISVNVSPRQFAQPDLVEQTRMAIKEAGIDPRCLRLEITETVTIGDTKRVTRVLTELRNLGVRLSIDDFGTGYSSLSYLHSLPLDVLKIDQSFVAAMNTSAEGLQVVRTIVSLARNLGMDIVAEGAEVLGQVSQLESMGCEFGQGYFFSRPIDLEKAAELLENPGWQKEPAEAAEAPILHNGGLPRDIIAAVPDTVEALPG